MSSNETEQDILKTIEYLNHQDIQGIKLQLLHVLKDTDLADIYLASPFYIPTPEEYYQLLGMCISHLRPGHRYPPINRRRTKKSFDRPFMDL